jgi:hypothetical protein
MLQSSATDGTFMPDVASLPNGIYLCKVMQGQPGGQVQKIAIVH